LRATDDQQNFLASQNWLATKWWRAMHRETSALSFGRRFGQSLCLKQAGVKENLKSPETTWAPLVGHCKQPR
jgi:hypothetical protein